MAITIIKAGDFSQRTDLENKVRSLIGLTAEPKDTHEIRGTQNELARLHLSSRSVFWGIKCVATDEGPPPEVVDKPVRGEMQGFGMDGNLKKPLGK